VQGREGVDSWYAPVKFLKNPEGKRRLITRGDRNQAGHAGKRGEIRERKFFLK